MRKIGYSPVHFGMVENVKPSTTGKRIEGRGEFIITMDQASKQIRYAYRLEQLPEGISQITVHFLPLHYLSPRPLTIFMNNQGHIIDMAGTLNPKGGRFQAPERSLWHLNGGHETITEFLKANFFQNTNLSKDALDHISQDFETAIAQEAKSIFTQAKQEWCRKK